MDLLTICPSLKSNNCMYKRQSFRRSMENRTARAEESVSKKKGLMSRLEENEGGVVKNITLMFQKTDWLGNYTVLEVLSKSMGKMRDSFVSFFDI